jgi:hypothetical protein
MCCIFGAFSGPEHHVLEEMREAAAALRLKAKSNLVVDTL